MQPRTRVAAAVASALLLSAGVGVAVAASSTPTATCTANPTISNGATTQSIRVTCSWPKPTASTATATVTTTATATATVTATATPTATAAPTATATPSPTPTPTPTATTAPKYPDTSTTGVPSGVTLREYTGSLSVMTDGTVFDGVHITGDLRIAAANVIIRNSRIDGTVTELGDQYPNASFTITDSEVHVGNQPGTGIGHANFTMTRVEVTGGNRSVDCAWKCTVNASYVHGQFDDATGTYHESGIRVGAYSTIRGNTILCDADIIPPDAGCSADLTGYPDYAVVEHNVIEGNLFHAAPAAAFCAYFGDTAGKAYSGQTNSITVRDNVFERGGNKSCALYGPFTDFPTDAASVWSNNKWDDGTTLNP